MPRGGYMTLRWLLVWSLLLVCGSVDAASGSGKSKRCVSGNSEQSTRYVCDCCSFSVVDAFAALVWHKHEKHPESGQPESGSAESAGSASASADDLAVTGKQRVKKRSGAGKKAGGRKRKASESDEDYCG